MSGGAIVITTDALIHWGITALLILLISVVTYFLLTRCRSYWAYKIERWRAAGRRKKRDSDEDDEDSFDE